MVCAEHDVACLNDSIDHLAGLELQMLGGLFRYDRNALYSFRKFDRYFSIHSANSTDLTTPLRWLHAVSCVRHSLPFLNRFVDLNTTHHFEQVNKSSTTSKCGSFRKLTKNAAKIECFPTDAQVESSLPGNRKPRRITHRNDVDHQSTWSVSVGFYC